MSLASMLKKTYDDPTFISSPFPFLDSRAFENPLQGVVCPNLACCDVQTTGGRERIANAPLEFNEK